MMFSFGCCTILVTAVKNFGGLMTLRWFLGMSESAFFPLVIYYQTTYVVVPILLCLADSCFNGSTSFLGAFSLTVWFTCEKGMRLTLSILRTPLPIPP